MFGRLFRAKKNRSFIDTIHGDIVAASRQSAFYAEYGVPDTLEGRFELLTLHAALVLRHLAGMPDPGPEMAQDLSNAVFRHFDIALREMGVSDQTVPKRIKTMAAAFLGRSSAYDAALRQGSDQQLAIVLARNIYGRAPVTEAGETPNEPLWRLTRYVRAAVSALEKTGAGDIGKGELIFPDPAHIA